MRFDTQVTFLGGTGQAWKLMVFLALLLSSLALFGLMVWALNLNAPPPWLPSDIALGLASVVIGLTGIGWLVLSIRCPRCRGFVAWWLVTRGPVSSWWALLVTSRTCPACDFRPSR